MSQESTPHRRRRSGPYCEVEEDTADEVKGGMRPQCCSAPQEGAYCPAHGSEAPGGRGELL